MFINKVIVHCSDSEFGDADDIKHWHLQRGFKDIGYHYVVLNGFRDKDAPYIASDDGKIESGRPINHKGAHTKGHNENSLGICLIGRKLFTGKQLYLALPDLLCKLIEDHNLTPKNIYGHCEFNNKKTCPNIDPELIRTMILTGDVRALLNKTFSCKYR